MKTTKLVLGENSYLSFLSVHVPIRFKFPIFINLSWKDSEHTNQILRDKFFDFERDGQNGEKKRQEYSWVRDKRNDVREAG